MVRAWDAFSVAGAKGEILANPAKFYSNPATPESLLKNSITVALAVVSDGIIVRPRVCYRAYVRKAVIHLVGDLGIPDIRRLELQHPDHSGARCASLRRRRHVQTSLN